MATARKYKLRQADIKIAFLHGRREHFIFITLLNGHKLKNGKTKIWMTKAFVYGLRDAPLVWYREIRKYFETWA